MTQSIKNFALTMLLSFGISAFVFAQNSFASNQVKTTNTNLTTAETTTTKVVEVSKQMEAKFANLFPNATEQKWTAAAENYFVSFLNDGRKANASISAKGNLNYVITECTLNQLPEDFSTKIKNNYAGYQLFHASEIKAHNAIAYQAVIENTTGFITLKYTADGIEEIQQVKK